VELKWGFLSDTLLGSDCATGPNPDKSKFLVIASSKRLRFYTHMCACSFFIGGKPVENVSQYSHLGHIINSSLSDSALMT